MARLIIGDFNYAAYFDLWDWTQLQGRSITRWGSPSNFSGGSNYRQSHLELEYNPGQSVSTMTTTLEMSLFRSIMGARAIVLSALWYFRQAASATSGVHDVRAHELIIPYPDLSDCTAQWKDLSLVSWYGAGYFAQYGHDISTNPVAQQYLDKSTPLADFYAPFDITDYFTKQLLRNRDMWLEFFQVTGTDLFLGTSDATDRPLLNVSYFHPLEMFPQKALGGIDLSRLLNTDNEPIDLGAYQKGEIGTPIMFTLKNFSRQTIAHSEVWDDFPEWTVPAPDAGNGGSGVLAYVEPFEACVSQRWEVKFTSSSAFEVKAEGYLDNLESLHPQYDADSNWEGTTAGDFDSPDGSMRIPSAAWSGTPATDDLFVFYSRGNTTDNSWPLDSNDQVEMCDDNVGSPSGDWRPITGQRTVATAGITIDAATKTVTVKRIDLTKWVIGTEVFIADSTNFDPGTIKSRTATTVEIENLSITNNVYAADAIVATTLPFRDIAGAAWAQLTAASGSAEPQPRRLYIAAADEYGFSGSQDVFIQSLIDPEVYEEGTISSITSGYLELDADLVNDYVAGATVAQLGSGEQDFWLRVVAAGATDEELKEFRLGILA